MLATARRTAAGSARSDRQSESWSKLGEPTPLPPSLQPTDRAPLAPGARARPGPRAARLPAARAGAAKPADQPADDARCGHRGEAAQAVPAGAPALLSGGGAPRLRVARPATAAHRERRPRAASSSVGWSARRPANMASSRAPMARVPGSGRQRQAPTRFRAKSCCRFSRSVTRRRPGRHGGCSPERSRSPDTTNTALPGVPARRGKRLSTRMRWGDQ
jgi:hypothetical protein